MTDTTRTIEIERAPGELLVLVATGVALTAGSWALAFRLTPPDAVVSRLLGFVGLVLFGFCTLVGIWQLFTARGAAITLSPQGIRDPRIAAETIPWSAVTDVSTLKYRYRKTVGITLAPEAVARLTLTFPLRWVRPINQAFGYDEFSVSALGTNTEYETLMADITAYWQAWRNRHAR